MRAGVMDLSITPLSSTVAAEVTGLDLSVPLNEPAKRQIYDAFLAHKILVFRNQDLTKDQQVAFTAQFGTLERHTARNRGTNDHPLVHVVSNLDADGKPMGKVRSDLWHTDKSFRPEPSLATILHARTLPPNGGDTLFADMAAAYDALSDEDRAALEGVGVVHSWADSRENEKTGVSEEERQDAPPMTHPLVRTHPDTNRKSLFVGVHAAFLTGHSKATGRARIEALEAHATQPQFTYRHKWRQGDVLMWDNRCLLHKALANFDAAAYPRILHRTCLRGTPTHFYDS